MEFSECVYVCVCGGGGGEGGGGGGEHFPYSLVGRAARPLNPHPETKTTDFPTLFKKEFILVSDTPYTTTEMKWLESRYYKSMLQLCRLAELFGLIATTKQKMQKICRFCESC